MMMTMKRTITTCLLALLTASATVTSIADPVFSKNLFLKKRPGFFRFSYDHVKMPHDISDMGLMGLSYYGEFSPYLYAGVGGYGSVIGTQGGLFVLGFAGGSHYPLTYHLWADANLFVGGGGGRSSLVGGGLMVRPSVGFAYEWRRARFGLHYSYISFPSGEIQSSQIGADVDIPVDFFYTSFNMFNCPIPLSKIQLLSDCFLNFDRNDFSLILQAYKQKPGTTNVHGALQDGTIGLVGAELDHFFLGDLFWYFKTSGAFHGIPNGYMDVLGGLGYKYRVNRYGFALIPQFGAGAGGGGNVDTGGGILIHPQLGFEIPLTKNFAARLTGGYLWAPDGELAAVTGTASVLYHLDLANESECNALHAIKWVMAQDWRIAFFNQTYVHPERVYDMLKSNINMVALQIDQFFTPYFFLSYQAASAYSGDHSGGYATGMIGPGVQTPCIREKVQLFAELLGGAGGGGSLSLGGGAIIEPVVGAHLAINKSVGLTFSAAKLKAVNHDLNTTVLNAGLTIGFATINDHY